ncbi:MAG: hypothetical protein ACEQR8_09565 [Cypionkella sp.]
MGVDEMPGKAYPSRIMLRRLLAIFALVTGLTAVGTPAQARMMAVMSQSVAESAQTPAANPSTACEIAPQRANLRSRAAPQTNCRPRPPVVIVIPTIQLGPDRARE